MDFYHAPPLLTIGMPVYNGANFIADAIESILSQSFTDFELIISDNASIDETPEICRKFAKRDKRIRYFRNSENIGAAANFNRIFHLGESKYFKWAAHDDELGPDYLKKCIDILESSNEIVLCHSQVDVIDGVGTLIRRDLIDACPLASDNVVKRFKALLCTDLDIYEVFGVIRRDVLEQTPLIGGYIASDRSLRTELGLHGKFAILAEPLFLCRDHPARSICAMPAHHMRGQWFDPKLKGSLVFPHWRILSEYFKCIGRVDKLTTQEKFACWITALRWLTIHQNWARLLADPLLVLVPGMERFLIRMGSYLAGRDGMR